MIRWKWLLEQKEFFNVRFTQNSLLRENLKYLSFFISKYLPSAWKARFALVFFNAGAKAYNAKIGKINAKNREEANKKGEDEEPGKRSDEKRGKSEKRMQENESEKGTKPKKSRSMPRTGATGENFTGISSDEQDSVMA